MSMAPPVSQTATAEEVLARCRDVAAAAAAAERSNDEEEDVCIICHDGFSGGADGAGAALELPDCHGHGFHRACLRAWLLRSPTCPVCQRTYGPRFDNMPPGTMTVARYARTQLQLPGHQEHGTIVITYSFHSGVQGPEHPNPGVPYMGTTRVGYLPDSPEGRELLGLLQRAFDQRLTFTVGTSITTGRSNVITWNGIHHKTSPTGGPTAFGYPDPTYLDRLRAELACKGIQ